MFNEAPTPPSRLRLRVRHTVGVLAAVSALLALAPVPAALAASKTWYVAPGGADAPCASNSAATPFATVQAAVQCAANGDVVTLAPSGATPYPGIGTVDKSVTIKGANARTVVVDVGGKVDAQGFTPEPMSVPAGASVYVKGLTLNCTGADACLSTACETTQCTGSLVVNNGTLTLVAVQITGAKHGAAINNVSAGSTPARLTVTRSTIAHNADDGITTDALAAGISSTRASASAPDPHLTVANSTLSDNNMSEGNAAGAIYTNAVHPGTVILANDTIVGNAGTSTGGIEPDTFGSTSPVAATNTIVAGNSSDGGPSGGPDCFGTIVDRAGGHNLIGDNTNCHGMTNGVNGDLVEVPNLGLNPLASNPGGGTDTISLQPQSPAIGAGDATTCQTQLIAGIDQRGVKRQVASRGCDIGAYDTATTGGAAVHTWYVAPKGTASTCASNTTSNRFATIQAAIACASDGDAIVLAPTGSTPYPGIGAVGKSVTIMAAVGSTAKSVVVELSDPSDSSGYSTGMVSIPASASVKLQNLGLQCTEKSGHLCLDETCPNTQCIGSLVANHGALSLSGVSVSGSRHGPAINNVSTGSTPARLTVTGSTIAHNVNDGLVAEGRAAGISSTLASGAAAEPQVTVANSTLSDNTTSFGDTAGAIYASGLHRGAVTLTNDTIAGNTGTTTGGIEPSTSLSAGPVIASNTIVAANSSGGGPNSGPDCFGTIADGPGAHNLIGDNANCQGMTNGVNGDRVGTAASTLDPKLAPLADNGGGTQTRALLVDSAAFSGGNPATCVAGPVFGLDQRRQARNAAGRGACDIGAYDTGGTPPS